MKVISILLLLTFLATSCGSNYEDAAGSSGLFAGHKPVEDSYTLIPPIEKIYLESETITLQLQHPFNVTVTGTPFIPVDIGGSKVNFNYISGSGSDTLSFQYTVTSGDLDLDGITQDSAIDLNGGTLSFDDGKGNTLPTTTSVPTDSLSLVRVDAVVPTVAITPVSILPNVYMNGQAMQVIALFPEFVEVTGTPQIALDLDGTTVFADYISGSGTTSLLFRYTITGSDVDLTGADMTSFNLNGGTVKDLSGNDADLTFAGPVNAVAAIVDGDTPYVVNYLTPTPTTYSPGQNIEFSLVFSEVVNVASGVPEVNLDIDGSTVAAQYQSGSGTDTLTFSYPVITGDVDLDGIEIDNSINLNGATIQDTGGTNALLTMAPPLTPNVLVDGTLPQVATITPPTDNTYTADQELYFTFNYNVVVNVTGVPRVGILLKSHNPAPVYADYSSGSGTDTLIFRYVVQSGEEDLDGITIQSPINLNGGTIVGYNNITADNNLLTQIAATDTTNIFVDDKAPSIISVIAPTDQNYVTGTDVDFTVNYSENVTVTGLPRIALDVGGSTLYATYSSGSGSTSLIFRYTVGAGDLDDNGIAFASTLVDLNSGTIVDGVGLNGLLEFTAIAPSVSGININYEPPVITSITPPADQYYNESEVLGFTVNTNVPVNISGGTPRIELNIGGQQAYAEYISGTGTTALYFALTIPAGLEDHDGINMVIPLDSNGANLQDVNLNNLDLNYTAPDLTNVFVDSLIPYIVSITPPANTTHILNDNLDFVLNYNENVDVAVATPRIAIDVDGVTRYADYFSGSGSNTLTFRYVAQAEEDNNGLTFVGSTIDLNGATIQDIRTNDTNVNLDAFSALPNLSAVLIDGIVPTITSITSAADQTYIIGEDLDFVVNFDDNVDITATPRIPLTLTSGTVYADYLSGTGTNAITFRYTVGIGDDDQDGVDIVSPLDLNGIGLIRDSNGNDADLTHTPSATPGLIIDGIIPTVTIDATTNITASNVATYNITGTCSENGEVVTVDVGGVSATPTCAGNVWSYTQDVSAVAESTDNTVADVAITADHDDAGGNSAVQATATEIKDTVLPTVSSNLIAANTYIIGDQVDLVLTFNENITPAGSETVDLTIGASTVTATQTAATTNTITYSYTIIDGEEDTNGIDNAANINLGAGSIADAVGNILSDTTIPTTNHATALVDGIRPTISNVTIAANTYYIGDDLDITLTFDDNVDIASGSPEIPLTFETVTGGPSAIYNSGTGTTSIVFRYPVISGNEDTNGIDLAASVSLSGATIKDTNGNDAILTLSSTNFPSVLVDAIQPTVTIDATSAITNANFTTYSMTGTCSENGQAVNVNIGGVSDSATCTTGTWATITDLTAVAESADNTVADVAITADHQDAGSNAAIQATDTQIKDTILPSISSNTISANTYIIGDQIDLVLTFNEDVSITGGESVDLTIGASTVTANQTANTSNTITYSYTVTAGDEDIDGIANAANITLGAGGFTDNVGNALTDTTIPTTAHPTVFVDGVAPSITNITIAPDTYGDGEQVDVVVTYDENVNIASGNPEMSFVFDTEVGDPKAVYASGTGSTTLTFSYTVATGNEDTDGIDLPATISLAGATIKDSNGNDANLTLSSTNFPTALVDAIAPLVAITSPLDATYINIASDSAVFLISGTCNVAGQTVTIKIDGVNATSPSGLLCDGVNFTGTIDSTGISDGARVFTAEITDLGSNTGVSPNINITKDTIAPVIAIDALSDVSSSNELTYTVSGTCDEEGATVNLAFGALTDNTVTCTSGTFSKTNWNVSTEADNAAVLLTADITDAAGNPATQATTNVLKDTTPPNIAITSPSDFAIIGIAEDSATYAVSGTCDENTATVDIKVDGVSATSQVGFVCDGTNFSGTIDTTGLGDGTYAFTAELSDAVGNLGTSSANNITKDTTAPTVAITTPVDSTYINIASNSATYSVSGTCNENGQTVDIRVDGSSAASQIGFVCDGTNFSGTIDTNGISEGALVLTAYLEDAGGNNTTSTGKNLTKDTVAPNIAIATPADLTIIGSIDDSATYAVSGTCDENTATVSIDIDAAPATSQVGFLCDGTNFSGTIDTTGLADATYAFTAKVTDAAGNESTSVSNNITKDATAPTVAITSPIDSSYINIANDSVTFAISGTCNESGQTVSILVDAGAASSPSGFLCDGTNFSGTIDTTALGQGAHTLVAELDDAGGNTGTSSTINVTKDTIAPVIAMTTPADLTVISTGTDSATYAVSGTCDENTATVSIEIDAVAAASQVGFICDGTNFSGTIDTTGLPDATFAFTAKVSDTAGNETISATNNVTKDATPPTVAITSPADLSYINIASDSATFAVSGTCNENGQTVVIKVDGVNAASPVGFVCDGTNFSGTIDSTGLAEATLAFTAELTDTNSNTGTSGTNNLTKDITAPVIALDALADVSSSNETTYTVSGTCNEEGATVDLAFGALTDSLETCSSGTFSKSAWNVSAEGDNASVLVTADITDAAGNPATQATTNVLKDTVGPLVAITTPADSSTITSATDSATFAVSGTCNESGQVVNIQIGGTDAASQVGFSCDGANFSGTIDTTGLAYTTHSFTAILSDAIGNETTSAANSVEKISYLVGIDVPTVINIANASSYTVSGTCSADTETVTVTVGGSVIDTPTCSGGTYTTASMDVSGLGDSATLSIDADHGTASDSTTVVKDTLAPTIGLNALANIAFANETSFPVSGTCSDDGENIDVAVGAATASGTCSSGTFSINVNTGIVSDGTSIVVTADHQDAAGNPSSQASTTTDKDATAPTVAITYSPDITGANESSYSISGSCSENGQTVNVNINGLAYTPNCSGGAWSVGPTDVSSRADNANLPITANTTDSFGNVGNGSTTVDKTTSVPTVAITNAPDISQANLTSYVVSGTCSENGTSVSVDVGGITKNPNCSSGTWATSQIDATSLGNGTVNITADHSTATQASTSVNKDTTSATVTITSAPNITISNELVYVASGTCSENGTNVDVYVDSLNYLVSCTSGTWTTGLVDVSSLTDGTGLLVTADHSTATQATQSINKETATPTVASLSVSTTLPDSADITWNLNDPGGFTIDDYTINYRVKGSPTWLTFVDGVSTTTSSTVTSLTASTTYEFRVRVEYDSGSSSEWSNTAEGETQPDDPLFGPNTAMNVGGSTTTTVVAHEDSTNITLNGGALVTLNKGQTHTFATVQFDVIDADKPIYTAGRRGSTTTSRGANVTWNPTAWAGKSFSFNATRTNPQKLEVYAIEDTFVEVKQGSTVLDSATVIAGNGTTLSWSVYGSYQVVATGSILAYHMSYDGTNMHDPKPLMPAHTEMIGFPSQSMRLTASNDGTNYNLIHSNSTTDSGSLNKADVIQVNNLGGTTSLYQGDSLLISADKKISGASFADSNGLCAAPFMPTNLMKTKYAINVNSDYAAFASKVSGTIEVRDASNTLITTLTLTRSGGAPNAPYRARMANPNAGYRFISTVPAAGWYQPRTNTGAGDQDETILYGTN